MIDIHTHILPGMDDGASDAETSREMLLAESKNHVDRLFLTPHFNCEEEKTDDFLARREAALTELNKSIAQLPAEISIPDMRSGAEVRYSPGLVGQELHRLTLGESGYLLLELPVHHYPAHIEQVVKDLDMMGITPILAHVERYLYFRRQPQLLLDLIEAGALGQVNAESLLDKQDKSFARACLEHSLAQFVASDTHNMTTRPPCMGALHRILPGSLHEKLAQYSEAVWEKKRMPLIQPERVVKGILRYR